MLQKKRLNVKRTYRQTDIAKKDRERERHVNKE